MAAKKFGPGILSALILPALILPLLAATLCLAAEEPATKTAPTSSSQPAAPLPKFPIQSEKFAEIDDRMDSPPSPDPKLNEKPEGMFVNTDALLDVVPALRASTQEHL